MSLQWRRRCRNALQGSLLSPRECEDAWVVATSNLLSRSLWKRCLKSQREDESVSGLSPVRVPFVLGKTDATSKFSAFHKSTCTGKSLDLSTMNAFPAYLPFYVFEGDINVTFDGKLGYTAYGWYTKERMNVSIPLRGNASQDLSCYAGFEYPRGNVFQALSPTSLLRDHHRGEPPRRIQVHKFEMKPSFALSLVLDGLDAVGERHAYKYLRSKPNDIFVKRDSVQPKSSVCPRDDSVQPDKVYVTNLSTSLCNVNLHERGFALLPVWVIDFKLQSPKDGILYRAFVNGQTGTVASPVKDYSGLHWPLYLFDTLQVRPSLYSMVGGLIAGGCLGPALGAPYFLIGGFLGAATGLFAQEKRGFHRLYGLAEMANECGIQLRTWTGLVAQEQRGHNIERELDEQAALKKANEEACEYFWHAELASISETAAAEEAAAQKAAAEKPIASADKTAAEKATERVAQDETAAEKLKVLPRKVPAEKSAAEKVAMKTAEKASSEKAPAEKAAAEKAANKVAEQLGIPADIEPLVKQLQEFSIGDNDKAEKIERYFRLHADLARCMTPEQVASLVKSATFSSDQYIIAKTVCEQMGPHLTCSHVDAAAHAAGFRCGDVVVALLPLAIDRKEQGGFVLKRLRGLDALKAKASLDKAREA